MPLKPWPRDAVIVTAALAGDAILPEMEGIHFATCRECGAALHACTFTARVAEHLPSRRGRPVEFFCPTCATAHEIRHCTEIHDHSGGRRDVYLFPR